MVEGTDLSKSLQRAGDGVEGILTFLDDNTMIAIATAKNLKLSLQLVSEILENHPESFFN